MGTARLVSFASGKAGVGTTSIVVNFAIELARHGQRVCVMDAAGGAHNATHLLGVEPAANLDDVIDGRTLLEQALVAVAGISVIASARVAGQLFDLDTAGRSRLLTALGELESRFDYLLIDCPAGAEDLVVRFAQAAHNVVVLVTPERQSRLDAFTLIKALHLNKVEAHIHLLCNLVSSRSQSVQVFESLQTAVRTYVGADLHYLGLVGPDPSVSTALAAQRPFALDGGKSIARRCLQYLATHAVKLLGDNGEARDETHAEDTGDTVDTGDIRGLGAYWMRSLFAGQKPVQVVPVPPAAAPPPRPRPVEALPSPWATLREQLRKGTLTQATFLRELAALLGDAACFGSDAARREALSGLMARVLGDDPLPVPGPDPSAAPAAEQVPEPVALAGGAGDGAPDPEPSGAGQPAPLPGAAAGASRPGLTAATVAQRERAGLQRAVQIAGRLGRR